MCYLPGFKYDVFLSYAHVDNATVNEEKGWITRFYEELKLILAKNVGRQDLAQIWWDEKLRKNQLFNEEIKDAIKNAAFFITFGSNGYYASEYCMNELKWFYDNGVNSSLGVSIKNSSRIYNILLNKKAHEAWPPACKGVNAYEMYELFHPERDNLGYPIEPGSDLFSRKIKELANDIFNTMLLIKEQVPAPVTEFPQEQKMVQVVKPKIFIARVTDTLLKEKNQIIKELEATDIEVIKKDFPPPYDKLKHEKAVVDALSDVCLTIHLFDQIPGDEIEDELGTFSQEQVQIAKQMKKDQLIFIPKDLNFDEIENEHHKKFLQQLQDTKKDNDNYTLIREFALPNIIHEIKEKICANTKKKEEQISGQIAHSVFLDFHEQDNTYAIEMANILYENNIRTFFSKYNSSPTENISNFETQLKKATSLIIICGKNIQEWVKERLNKAIQTIMMEDCPVSECAIYLAPQVQNVTPFIRKSFLQIQYLDDSKSSRFNPETVIPFIKKFV